MFKNIYEIKVAFTNTTNVVTIDGYNWFEFKKEIKKQRKEGHSVELVNKYTALIHV